MTEHARVSGVAVALLFAPLLVQAGARAQAVPPALAQGVPRLQQVPSASEFTPQTFRPPIENTPQGGGFVVPQTSGPETPVGADKLFVRLAGVTVDGGFPELAAETQKLEAQLVRQNSVSGAEIFATARALEAAYAQAGFVLARVVLPPQDIKDGSTLTLKVVDGFIQSVEVADVSPGVRSRIQGLVAPLIGKRHLRLSELERRVLLAGDTYGVVLRSTLAPGTEIGGTILALETNYQPVNGVVSVENALPLAFNSWSIGFGADLNSVLGLGELIYARAFGNPLAGFNDYTSSNPTSRALAVGVVVPIGYDGFTVNVEATKAQATPVAVIPGLTSSSDFERLSLRARYPWIRSRQTDFATDVAFDFENDKQTLGFAGATFPLSEDRLRVLRLGGNGQYAASWGGVVSGQIITSFGLNVLGARTSVDANQSLVPLSRLGADASFAKIEAGLNYSQPLLDTGIIGAFTARAQTSFNTPLARAERFIPVSPQGLSTFDGGTFAGDSGYVARGEVGKPFLLPEMLANWSVLAQPYAFGAIGQVFTALPTILEPASITAASYGIGVRFNDAEKGTRSAGVLTLEFGAQQRSDGILAGVRGTLLFSQKF